MKKILLGVLIGLGLTALVVKAGYVQDYAWVQQITANVDYENGVRRIEWYGDVCYIMKDFHGSAISCLKK